MSSFTTQSVTLTFERPKPGSELPLPAGTIGDLIAEWDVTGRLVLKNEKDSKVFLVDVLQSLTEALGGQLETLTRVTE